MSMLASARHPRDRVLVVNDDERLAHAVRLLLSEEGFDARVATDGEVALQLVADWPPDLILLDLVMPRLDGWDFLRVRAQAPSMWRVPVLVWSVADPEDLKLAVDLGATVYLPRDAADVDELLNCVAALLVHGDDRRPSTASEPARPSN
jgi:DNA-binding response OmpR family regulator